MADVATADQLDSDNHACPTFTDRAERIDPVAEL
jgi:hypothetical protein